MKQTILRQTILSVAAIVLPVITSAQETADTIAAQNLKEIVVQPPK